MHFAPGSAANIYIERERGLLPLLTMIWLKISCGLNKFVGYILTDL